MSRLSVALLIVLASGIAFAGDEERYKMPTPEERAAATKLVRDLFKAEFAKTSAAAKSELAATLFKQACDTKDDLPSQFVLLRETVDLAAAGGTNDLAIQAAEMLLKRFDGPTADLAEPVYKAIGGRATTPDNCANAAGFLMRGTEDLLTADQADAAARVQKFAEDVASRSKNVRLMKAAQALGKDVESYRTNKVGYATAVDTLAQSPDDAKACLVVGKFLCFQKGDWTKGLEFLAKSSDEKLKAAARKDLDAAEDDPAATAAAADAWYDAILTLDGYPKRTTQARIYKLYSGAVAKLTGVSKVKAEKRIEELEKALDGRFDHPKLWPVVRAAVKTKSYDKLEPMGGAFGKKEYEEIPPDGAILIGFHYTLKKFFDKDLIDCFQAIYLTPNGEKLGPPYGNFKAAKMLTFKAKPNYAIGKMAVRGGGLWGGVNVHFMRIQGAGLNPADSYETGWVGHKDQPDAPFLGDGRPIVGLHGTLQNERDGGGICSIGLYLAGDKPKPKR